MDFDITPLLEGWEFQPGQVMVRRFEGKDGREKVQLRVDLGVLQMNAEGRPDGKRPYGYSSLFDYYQARRKRYLAANNGSDVGYVLKPDDCARLQLEAMQYHQRYFCMLQLEDYPGAIRDAERNLAVFDFVARHAPEEYGQAIRQFEPQLLMVLTRARASQALENEDFTMAIHHVEEGLQRIRTFYLEHEQAEAAEHSGEILSLETWLEEIRNRRPLSPREKLERALSDAVNSEDYERAAQVRDELKNLPEA